MGRCAACAASGRRVRVSRVSGDDARHGASRVVRGGEVAHHLQGPLLKQHGARGNLLEGGVASSLTLEARHRKGTMRRAHQTGVRLGGFGRRLLPRRYRGASSDEVSRCACSGAGAARAPSTTRGNRRPTRTRDLFEVVACRLTRSHVVEGRALDVRGRGTDAEGRGRVSPMESRMFARAKVRRMSRRAGARAWAVRAGAVFDPFVPRKESIIRNPALFPREFDPRTSEIRKAPTRFHRGFAGGDRSATRIGDFTALARTPASRLHGYRLAVLPALTAHRGRPSGPSAMSSDERAPLLDPERGASRPVGWRFAPRVRSRGRDDARGVRGCGGPRISRALRASGPVPTSRPPEQPRPPVHLRRRPRTRAPAARSPTASS